jgi:hypothetical protein
MLRLSYKGKSRQKTIALPGWAAGLMAAGVAGLGIALFLLVSTIALLLLPFLLVAGGVTAFIMRKRIEKMIKSGAFPAGGFPSQGFPPQGFPGEASIDEREAAARAAKRRAEQRVRGDIEDADYRVVDEPPRKGA